MVDFDQLFHLAYIEFDNANQNQDIQLGSFNQKKNYLQKISFIVTRNKIKSSFRIDV